MILNVTSVDSEEKFMFVKQIADDKALVWKTGGKISEEQAGYYLKIQKIGIEYTGYISHDGYSWVEVGRHYFPGFSGSPCFGGLSDTGTEKAVKVDLVELKALGSR